MCKISQKFAVAQGLMGGAFMFSMFSFYIYVYGIGSELMWQGYINPVSGERYQIAECVAVAMSVMIAMMVFPSIMPIIPATI